MHKLLARQLRRFFGSADAVPESIQPFVAAVEDAYRQADDDRAMVEHSMETVSVELADRFRKLRDAQEQRDEINQALSLLTATLESTADGIVVVDLHGQVVRFNTRFAEIWGMPPDVLERASDGAVRQFALSQVEDPEEFAQRLGEIYGQPDEPSFDVVRLKDGRAFERHSLPQRLTGITVGRVWSYRDITARRHLEDQLRQAQKMDAIGQLAGGVAHDFNNLLTVIRAHAEFLAEDINPSASMHEDVDAIIKAGRRAAALTHQLLAFSRKQMLQAVVFDLNTVVTGLEPMLRRLIGEDIAVTTRPADVPAVLEADPGQMEQVVVNLAINARDAMPRGGRLEIAIDHLHVRESVLAGDDTVPPGHYVVLAVTDTGVGIPRDQIGRIFEPFFTTKDVGKGTGLGLSTLYGIVKQSGGYVGVESEVGVGTTFRIYLPRAAGSAATPTRVSTPMLHRAEKHTVLIAEDEEEVGKLLRRVLEAEGHRVLVAPNGKEALMLASHYPGSIDLLITDVIMPEMGGRELAEQLRQARARIRVLYISGYTKGEIDRRGVLQADGAFLEKPFTGSQLSLAVRAALDETGTFEAKSYAG